MLPSTETCQRWSRRKFIQQPFRAVAGMILCLVVTCIALFNGQWGAVGLFGALAGLFILLYAIANYIVWKAGTGPGT